MPIDRPKLIKLMAMTQSSNDSEALIAIRKANEMLKANKLDWDSAIKGTAPAPVPRPRPTPRPMGRGTNETAPSYPPPKSRYTDRDIPRILSSLLRDSKGSFRDFVESINEAWEKYGYLTERQYEAIINAYERAK